jgi:hypothetical protein
MRGGRRREIDIRPVFRRLKAKIDPSHSAGVFNTLTGDTMIVFEQIRAERPIFGR